MAATTTETIRVLVADDDAPTREGLRLVLERGGLDVCAEAGDATSAVEAALRERPDICLLDLRIPGSGIAATAEITRKLPQTRVIVLTGSAADEDLFDSLRAGASGYLPKDIDPQRLPRALRAVQRGEAAIPRWLVARLIEEFRERGRRRRLPLEQRPAVELTGREWEVLDLLRQGLGTSEIASRLFIAEGTVRTHVAAVLRKLDVDDRVSAVRLLEQR
jgi:two-component system, NarL family, nitrate/nitrite response regulator NarL